MQKFGLILYLSERIHQVIFVKGLTEASSVYLLRCWWLVSILD